MKKEELTALGITEEQAEKILELNAGEISAANSELAEAKARLSAAERNAAELTERVKAFDGADVNALKKAAADWETKYNADITAAKVDNAVSLALAKAGAKDVDLAKHLIDTSVIKLDGGKALGLSEQLEKIMSEKAFLFESGPAGVSTGMEHTRPSAPARIHYRQSERIAKFTRKNKQRTGSQLMAASPLLVLC